MNYVALWINQSYVYGCINELGKFEAKLELTDQFPVVDDINMEIVKTFNIPELGYTQQENGGFKIFDKTKEVYNEYILPVYVKVFDKITRSKERRTLIVPTEETLEAARVVYRRIQDEFFKLRTNEEFEELRAIINKGNGIAYIKHSDFPHLDQILFNSDEFIRLFEYQYEFYIIGIQKNDPRLKLSLKVPQSLVGKVIGKGGKNVKEMAEKIGVMRIDVTAI